MADLSIAEIKRRLRILEKRWPKGGLMLMSNGHFIYLCDKHPEDGGRVIESFQIPCDGGDPDWEPDNRATDDRPKRLVEFQPPSESVYVGPRPDFNKKEKPE